MSKTKKIWIGVCAFVIVGGGIAAYATLGNSAETKTKKNQGVSVTDPAKKKRAKKKVAVDPLQDTLTTNEDPLQQYAGAMTNPDSTSDATSFLVPTNDARTSKIIAMADQAMAAVDAKRESTQLAVADTTPSETPSNTVLPINTKPTTPEIITPEKPSEEIVIPPKEEPENGDGTVTPPVVPPVEPPVTPEPPIIPEYPVSDWDVAKSLEIATQATGDVMTAMTLYKQGVQANINSLAQTTVSPLVLEEDVAFLEATYQSLQAQYELLLAMEVTDEAYADASTQFSELYDAFHEKATMIQTALGTQYTVLESQRVEIATIVASGIDSEQNVLATIAVLEGSTTSMQALQEKDTAARYKETIQQEIDHNATTKQTATDTLTSQRALLVQAAAQSQTALDSERSACDTVQQNIQEQTTSLDTWKVALDERTSVPEGNETENTTE
ncbi:hypothetical protein HCA69_15590 [Listeria grandensis]|uniref:Uncharacterized protein n=1 Tax=Listeria grandensis TaxID=1494963 RepID=A0A7X1CR82_9LIST|nr:hypothetical protein [Listeria grandensis]MBC1937792.1 hypothetical protein [Listeria grandensis]